MLALSRKVGETIRVRHQSGDVLTFHIVRFGATSVRIGIEAEREVFAVARGELVASDQQQHDRIAA
jgi:sRNA-binding carbon storage regulator CsrA